MTASSPSSESRRAMSAAEFDVSTGPSLKTGSVEPPTLSVEDAIAAVHARREELEVQAKIERGELTITHSDTNSSSASSALEETRDQPENSGISSPKKGVRSFLKRKVGNFKDRRSQNARQRENLEDIPTIQATLVPMETFKKFSSRSKNQDLAEAGRKSRERASSQHAANESSDSDSTATGDLDPATMNQVANIFDSIDSKAMNKNTGSDDFDDDSSMENEEADRAKRRLEEINNLIHNLNKPPEKEPSPKEERKVNFNLTMEQIPVRENVSAELESSSSQEFSSDEEDGGGVILKRDINISSFIDKLNKAQSSEGQSYEDYSSDEDDIEISPDAQNQISTFMQGMRGGNSNVNKNSISSRRRSKIVSAVDDVEQMRVSDSFDSAFDSDEGFQCNEPEGTPAAEFALLNHYIRRAADLSQDEGTTKGKIKRVISLAKEDGLSDEMINDVFDGLVEPPPKAKKVKKIDIESDKLEYHIEQARKLGQSNNPSVEQTTLTIIKAMHDGIPVKPIVHQLDESFQSKSLDADKFDFKRMENITKVASLNTFIMKAIKLVENATISNEQTDIICLDASESGVDDTILREILENPEKHVMGQQEVKLNSDGTLQTGEKKVKLTIYLKKAKALAQEDGSWEQGIKVLLKEAKAQSLPLKEIKTEFMEAKKKFLKNKQGKVTSDKSLARGMGTKDDNDVDADDEAFLSYFHSLDVGVRKFEYKVIQESNESDKVDNRAIPLELRGKNATVDINVEASPKFTQQQDSTIVAVESKPDFVSTEPIREETDEAMNPDAIQDSPLKAQQVLELSNTSNVSSKEGSEGHSSCPSEDDKSDLRRKAKLHHSEDTIDSGSIKSNDSSIASEASEDKSTYESTGKLSVILSKSSKKRRSKRKTEVQFPPLDAVKTTREFRSKKIKKTLYMPEENREFLWKLTLVERVKGHPGFKGVDKTSILNTTFVEEKEIDVVIWDDKKIDQRTLYERRISATTNWFGSIGQKLVHRKIHEPICRPHSVPAPDDLCTYAWDEDWYASWYTKKHNLNKLRHQEKRDVDDDDDDDEMDNRTQGTFLSRLTTKTTRTSRTRKSKYSSQLDSPDALRKEMRAKAAAKRFEKPEIGTLHTLRYKMGERTTRVHYDYTSMLRKSRWKKKYVSKKMGKFLSN